MNPVAEDVLMHYGIKRRSGRYPWGSGKNPFQHGGDLLSRVEELKSDGLNEKEIADEIGLSTSDLRIQIRVAKHQRRELEADRARSLREDGKSLNEIAQIMGYKNDSSVRSLLNENTAINKNRANVTADILKKELSEKGMIDVGAGVNLELGCSNGTLKEAIFILETKGCGVYGVGIPQINSKGKQTNTPVLFDPEAMSKNKEYADYVKARKANGVDDIDKINHSYIYNHMGDIQSVGNYHSVDGGTSYNKLEYPASVDSSRIFVKYGDKGGIDKDGVIEIRRGVKDLDLGNSHYAQVRILTDGTHYLKGMAIYSDDIPEGYDIVFNTNKRSGTPKEDVFKEIKEDIYSPNNPFGAAIKAGGQSYYDDPKGKYIDPITGKRQSLSAINKLKEEGDWDRMSRTLSSQFLSKQPMKLINKQLDLTYSDKIAEYEEICSLTNPVVKKKLLLDFASECDSAAVHLQAAALPRQTVQVILPTNAMKDNEVYAPNYNNGEKIALVRYPHAGTFEIPILTVNNKNKQAKDIFGNMTDAIAINPNVAQRLSGADFDGDFVVAIPTNDKVRIKSTKALDGLKDFDPKTAYPYKEGMKVMNEKYKQKQMGIVSNLITDMQLRGANEEELARAVRHSMVVIDAVKHKLDYKQSEKDNGIAELKKKYQGYTDIDGKDHGGASTLISRSGQTVDVPERKGSPIIDPETGKLIYKTSGREYINKKGELVKATTEVPLISETDDLRTLSSGTPEENAYADYGNRVKALANQARKEYLATRNLEYSPSAKATYINEVNSLNAKLNIALKDAPKQRKALAIANSRLKAQIQDNPGMDKEHIRKAGTAILNDARYSVGASGKNSRINITEKEWEAIQAGAITSSKLTQILRYSDPDLVRQYATPKTTTQMSSAKIAKMKSMSASGYTIAEIAKAVGCSTSTASSYIRG